MRVNKIKNYINEHRALKFLFIFVVVFLLIVFRKPDLISNPQFWAEDGAVWFQDAYNIGVRSFFLPSSGYFQTISRLAASIAQLFPLQFAPLFFNLLAIVVKALPVLFLFSSRLSRVVPGLKAKLLVSALYIFLPNTSELYSNVTNAHSYLALLSFLIIIADAPKKLSSKIFYNFFLLLSGLSGPFVIFLVPMILLKYLYIKNIDTLKRFYFLYFSFLVQFSSLVLGLFSSRSAMELGASTFLFVKISAGQIFLGSVFGSGGYGEIDNGLMSFENLFLYKSVYVFLFIILVFVYLYSLLKAKIELKLFIVFSLITYLAAMLKPMASFDNSQWEVMALPGNTTRYWFFPSLAFLLSVLYLVSQNKVALKISAYIIVTLFVFNGYRNQMQYGAWPDRRFSFYVQEFNKHPEGQEFRFPIMPPSWEMKLIKK